MHNWIVEIRLYDFQNNPKWILNKKNERKLKSIFRTIDKYPESKMLVRLLNKYTVNLYFKDILIIACTYNGLILKNNNTYYFKNDANKEVERLLIKTAPKKYQKDIEYYLKINDRIVNK